MNKEGFSKYIFSSITENSFPENVIEYNLKYNETINIYKHIILHVGCVSYSTHF